MDARSGALTAWDPAPDSELDALLAAPGGLVFSGIFEAIGGAGSHGLAFFPAAP